MRGGLGLRRGSEGDGKKRREEKAGPETEVRPPTLDGALLSTRRPTRVDL